jgi:hypothetical protein
MVFAEPMAAGAVGTAHMHALIMLVSTAAVLGQARAQLPLHSLVLYENGVGYFERHGSLSAGATAEIPLEAGQLDDTLKSLVVVSEHGVASVEFAPPLAVDAARAMAGLPAKETEASLASLLHSLQGVDVVVTQAAGANLQGRVIEVTHEDGVVDKEGKQHQDATLLLFGEAGLSKVRLTDVRAVRPTGAAVSLAWSRAVGSTALQPERERLMVRGASGGGAVAVGYTTEAPVWRTTYRLVMGPRPRLQGFALVHNDSDEAWNGVKVSLASGKPTSFLFPLAGPRYGRRDLIAPEDGLDTAPQLSTREAREHLRGSLEVGGVEGGSIGLGSMGTRGYGSGGSSSGSHGMVVRGPGSGISSTVLEDGPTPLEPAAVSEAGDLFLYTVKEPVVLGARKSALLPIIDGATGAERVTLLDRNGAAFTAVRLQNTTPLTLEGGTLSVFADGAYAGETQVDRVKPNEVRVLKHGVDLDLEVTRSTRRDEGTVRKARVMGAEGARLLELTRVDRLVHTVGFTSRAAVSRTVLVELPENGYRVVSGGTEDVRSPGQPRYGRVVVVPHAREDVDLVEEGAVVERITADSLSSTRLTELLKQKLADDVRATLVSVQGEIVRAEQEQVRVAALEHTLTQLNGDLTRVRENLAAAGKGGATSAAKELGERLIKLEDTLQKTRAEHEAALGAVVAARKRLLVRR